ncbi:unnamed protein product [Pleuronectes platessa]|uniref:VWFD domain-containing protein n=1 Tax=Pleuronectes platessa TaxID=8262 RepID=A0A9N7W183_PLEPL|nr:unnamed protein product [Pleuronectes platessa]
MAATVLLPSEFTDHTLGFLGFMNSDPSDDLLTRPGEVIPSHGATPEGIFTFGTGCEKKVPKTSSLFTHDSKRLLDAHSFAPSPDPVFVLAFSPPETPHDPLVADMGTACVGEGARCLNGRPAARNGKMNGTRYLEGNTLSFSCDEEFIELHSVQIHPAHVSGGWDLERRAALLSERAANRDFLVIAIREEWTSYVRSYKRLGHSWTQSIPAPLLDDSVRFILGAVGSITAVL